jgi:hypothetical protein
MKSRAEVQKAYRERQMRENPELVRMLERARWRRRCRAMRTALVQQYDDANKRKLYLIDERTYNSIRQQTNTKQHMEEQSGLANTPDEKIRQRASIKSAVTAKKRTVVKAWDTIYNE